MRAVFIQSFLKCILPILWSQLNLDICLMVIALLIMRPQAYYLYRGQLFINLVDTACAGYLFAANRRR